MRADPLDLYVMSIVDQSVPVGMLRALELECSQHPYRYRLIDDAHDIEIQRVRPHGQWGVAVDDLGRCWYSPNSEPLLVDLFPKHYAVRNDQEDRFHGVGVATPTP